MTLQMKDVTFSFADKNKGNHLLLSNLNLTIKQGEFVSLIGKSGSGKSTILKLIAGLLQSEQGTVAINGKAIALGDVGYMPQRDLLLPWRTILENIMLATELQKDVVITKNKARNWLKRVGLHTYENAYPYALSGGMRQRAAFLRTLLVGKEMLLLDEPFGALDALTKKQMQTWLLSIWQDLEQTILFITHDLEEAVYMSDRIVILSSNQSLEEYHVPLSRPRHPDMKYSNELIKMCKNLEKKIANEEN